MDYDLNLRFTYRHPFGNKSERYNRIRLIALSFADVLVKDCPDSDELLLAIGHLEEAVFWASAAIARHEENLK